MKIRGITVTAIVAALVASSALACGDSLHRVGKGVSYRTYSAPLPGNLLLLTTSESTRELAEQLASSGHGVREVHSMAELTAELRRGGYDVVIAPFGERATIESTSAAAFLPVVASRDEEKQARRSFDRVMVSGKHKIKHYLKAIHLTLKNDA